MTNEDHIFSRLLGEKGLLRQLRTTVILVTHAAHRLSYADHILVLDINGSVSEQGNFDSLMKNNGYVASLSARHIIEGKEPAKEDTTLAAKPNDDDTARENAAADIQRPIGDPAVYSYYLKSIGWHSVLAWVGSMITFSTLLRFPGTAASQIGFSC